MDLDKPLKTGTEIVAGATTALKNLPEKATNWKEPAQIAMTGIAGIPIEYALDQLSEMVLNAFGAKAEGSLAAIAIKLGIKFGVPIGIGSIFMFGKLPFSKLVAVAAITTIIIAIVRELAKKFGFNIGTGATKAKKDDKMELVHENTKWNKLVS